MSIRRIRPGTRASASGTDSRQAGYLDVDNGNEDEREDHAAGSCLVGSTITWSGKRGNKEGEPPLFKPISLRLDCLCC